MRYLFPLLVLIFLFSCSENEKDIPNSSKEITVSNTLSEIDTMEKSEIYLEKILSIIDSIYDLDSVELNKKFWGKERFFKHIDSTNMIEWKSYLTFTIFEFQSPEFSKKEYEKIKSIKKKIDNQEKFEFDPYDIFVKSGVTYVLLDNFIISHQLRCNMEKHHYDTDTEFAKTLTSLSTKSSDWLTFRCGGKAFYVN